MLVEFLKNTFKNVRGKLRTDALHNAILAELWNKYPTYKDNYVWRFEEDLHDAYNGKFKVDIVGYDKDLNPKIAILCKCANSNIGKNKYNYANCTIGEAARLTVGTNHDFEKVLFVNVLPTKAPIFETGGTVSGYDKPIEFKKRVDVSPILFKFFGNLVEEVNMFYDIEHIETKTNKKDFTEIVPLNLSEFRIKYE